MMMRIAGLLVAMFLATVGSAAAWEYYVNSVSGNDRNAGTTPRTAWKTIARVNEASFMPGDNIYLKRGCIWEETLLVSSSGSVDRPVTFSAYGNGDRPLLKCSNRFEDWKPFLSQGAEKVWEGRMVGVKNSWGAVRDGVRMIKYYEYPVPGNEYSAPSRFEEMKEGYFFAPLNEGRFFVRNDTGKPPALDIGARKCGIYVRDKRYVVIDNIDVTGPTGNEDKAGLTNYGEIGYFLITIEASDHVTIENCVTRYGSNGGVLFIRGSSNGVLSDVESCDHRTTGIYFWEAGEANSAMRCRVHDCGTSPCDSGDMGLIGVWKTPGVEVGDCELSHNGHPGAKAIDAAISFVRSPWGVVRGCRLRNVGGTGIQFGESSDYGAAAHNVIDRWGVCRPPGHSEGIRVGGGIGNSTARGCKIYNNLLAGGGANLGEHAALRVLSYVNDGLQVKNNIFYKNDGVYDIYAESRVGFQGWVFSHNFYFRTAGNAVKWNGQVYDFAHVIGTTRGFYSFDWRQEDGSLVGEPRVKDDLSALEENSPCIGSGIPLENLPTSSGSGHAVNSKGVDIGPFMENRL